MEADSEVPDGELYTLELQHQVQEEVWRHSLFGSYSFILLFCFLQETS